MNSKDGEPVYTLALSDRKIKLELFLAQFFEAIEDRTIEEQ